MSNCINFRSSSFSISNYLEGTSLVTQEVNLPAMQEIQVQYLGWEDPPAEGNGNPLQYSCLWNPMDRGSWQATVHGDGKKLDSTEQLTLSLQPFKKLY